MTQSPPAMLSQIQPTEMAYYRLHNKFAILGWYPSTWHANHPEIYYSIDVIYQSKTYQISETTIWQYPCNTAAITKEAKEHIDVKIKKA